MKLINLISRVFLAWTFLILWPTVLMKGVFPVIKHVVHPSKYEMQPISYMIAQYSQVTVVGSLIGKISES